MLVRSADAIELAGICDRVVIVSRGQIVRELVGADLSEDRIVEAIIRTQSVTPHRRRSREPLHLSASRRHAPCGECRRASPATGEEHGRAALDRPWVPVVALAVLRSSSARTPGVDPTPSSPSST